MQSLQTASFGLFLKGVLHPKQIAVLTANRIRAPEEGAAIEMVRVWFPARREVDFSPITGSNIRIKGFESWLSR